MPLSTDEIEKIVDTIHNYTGTMNKTTLFKQEYPEFYEQQPALFEMVCKPNFNIERFKRMTSLKKQIDKNEITLYDASAKVGTELYNEYVKAPIDKVEKFKSEEKQIS
jgi:hypothetical protein